MSTFKFMLGLVVTILSFIGLSANEETNFNNRYANISSDNITVFGNSSVTLNALETLNSHETSRTYSWKQLSGKSVTLYQADDARATFTAPNQNTQLVFQVTETDKNQQTNVKTLSMTIEKELILGMSSNQIWQ